MNRRTYQQGYVSEPIRTRQGTGFKIRYRIRAVNGAWKQKSEMLYGLSGKKAARSILNERLQSASNQKPEVDDLTVSEFVETYWRPSLERKKTKPSTRRGYDSVLRCHIVPMLGGLRLVDCSPMHVEELLQVKTKAGLSPTTIRNVIIVLQGIFAVAVEDDLIPKSPVRRRHKPAVVRSNKTTWTPEQIRSIIDAAPPEYRALFTTVALTGVRMGELLGLQWKHVDFEANRLRIEQSIWYGQLGKPKTLSSVRTILFGNALAGVLTQHLQDSRNIGQNDFVFCKKDGSPLNPDVLRKDVLYPTLDRLNIPRPKRGAGFHMFRHSAASLINDRTGNLKLAQGLLGHSDISTTADVYTHTSSESQREATGVIERAIFQDLFPVVPKTGNGNKFEEGQ